MLCICKREFGEFGKVLVNRLYIKISRLTFPPPPAPIPEYALNHARLNVFSSYIHTTMHIRDISFTTSTLYVCLFQPKAIRLQTKETNLMKTILQVQQHRVGGEQGEEGDRGRQGGAGIQLHEGQPGTVPF